MRRRYGAIGRVPHSAARGCVRRSRVRFAFAARVPCDPCICGWDSRTVLHPAACARPRDPHVRQPPPCDVFQPIGALLSCIMPGHEKIEGWKPSLFVARRRLADRELLRFVLAGFAAELHALTFLPACMRYASKAAWAGFPLCACVVSTMVLYDNSESRKKLLTMT